MQKVLYLSRGGNIGGSQRQIFHVIKNMDPNLFAPVVVCKNDGQFVNFLKDNGIETHVINMRPWRKFPIAMLRCFDVLHLALFAYTKQVKLIHASDLWLCGYLTTVARLLNIPSILHVRTPVTGCDVRKHAFVNATSIIAISRRVKNNLIDAGIPDDKISLIYDSVDVDAFAPEMNKKDILRRQFHPKGKTLIGIVGRIDGFKKQLEFLKAAAKVNRNSFSPASFLIIGPQHSQDYFQKIKRFISFNRLRDDVYFTGGRKDMPAVLASLDMLVSLSGGSVMFEAMAAGKAVISAGFSKKVNSVHIQDQRTGILIESRDNDELASAMKRLIEDSALRRQIGNTALQWARQRLCHKLMTAKTQQLYLNVLSCHSDKMDVPVAIEKTLVRPREILCKP